MKAFSHKAAIGYLMAVFAAGLMIGGMVGYIWAGKSPSKLPSEEQFEAGWLAKYKAELSLSEEQVRAIQPLLPKAVRDVGGVWYRAIMTMGAIHESVDRKIEPLLNDAQREKLLAWIREGRQRRLSLAQAKLPKETEADSDLWSAAKHGNLEAIYRHLQDGADINRHDLGFGLTPLSMAAIHDQADAVELLLQKGAAVNVRHPEGNTVLHGAAFFGRLEPVTLLLAHGADPHARNDEGKTPLEGMEADWETVQFIAAILDVEFDKEKMLAGRKAVAGLLTRGAGQPAAPQSNASRNVPDLGDRQQ